MAKSITILKAQEHIRKGRYLMVTYGASPAFTIDGVGDVSPRNARALIGNGQNDTAAQGDLFLQPNEDGLFPGFTQTWKAS